MRLSIVIFLFLITSLCYSQQEASVWYFGQNAGLKFHEDGSVSTLGDGQLNTKEGCSSIADGSGNLLFYTDGRTVWDSNHVIMPHGDYFGGTGLLGDPSSTQSAIIVPKPDNPNLYYIFTVDEPHHENAAVYPNAFSGTYLDADSDGATPNVDDGLNNGLNYSIVDMSVIGSNGSMGDITQANMPLITYNIDPSGEEIKYKCSEKITAVKNTSDNSYWVITHFVNRFYAFKVSVNGVSSTPIISTLNPIVPTSGYRRNAIGYLKASPNGEKLLIAHQQNVTTTGSEEDFEGSVYVYDFDINSGIVSNPMLVMQDITAYGVEFSNDSKKAYVSYSKFEFGTGINANQVSQFDLESSDIPNSRVLLFDSIYGSGALQLALNGKIYCACYFEDSLSVINDPNVLGTGCNFDAVGQALAPNTMHLKGLPPFITSFFNQNFLVQNLCLGSQTEFQLTPSTVTVSSAVWDFGDGSSSTDLNPNHTYSTAGTYNVTLVATSENGISNYSRQIIISQTPIAYPEEDQFLCGSSYPLIEYTPTILNGQSEETFGIAYFASEEDAIAHINQLTSISSITGTITLYAKVYNLQSTSCFDITHFNVTHSFGPSASQPQDYIICESPPYNDIEAFDLSSIDPQVLGSLNPADYTITYYADSNDAVTGTNPLSSPFTITFPLQAITARIIENTSPYCGDFVSFNIGVIQAPTITPISDFVLCDDSSGDGMEMFDLTEKTNEILGVQSPNVFEVKYYPSQLDAQNDTNEITAPIVNSVNNQTVYVKVSGTNNNACSAFSSFNLVVSGFATANPVENYFVCDDLTNDGIELFDFSLKTVQILGSQSSSQYAVSYFSTEADANANQNVLPLNYQNNTNPETIYARVQNDQNTDCFAVSSFQIGLYKFPLANELPDLVTCDDESNDGSENFDLSSQTQMILGNQSPSDFNVSYYSTFQDAQTSSNQLGNGYSNLENPQTIYARIENKLSSQCFETSSFNLIVEQKPVLNMDPLYSICQGHPITITAPTGFDSYLWSTDDTSDQITVTQPGNYSITVARNYGALICDATKNFTVVSSNAATITNIDTRDWTNDENIITVEVSGEGDYEYSIDGIHYQDSNQFSGLAPGEYSIYVNDKNGCGVTTDTTYLIMYPKFFTPNGDGVNDVWQVKLSQNEPDMEIYIFDRYGKLVKSFNGRDFGWDGLMNGNPLPSTDYWFLIKRENGKEFRGHFSLKR